MDQETTRHLSRLLQNVRDDISGEKFIEQYSETGELHTFLNYLLAKSGITITELIERSCVNKNYIYNILNGERKSPGRDKVIALCIGLEAGFRNTNRALELVKYAPLYPKDERDARIAIAINQGVHSVTDVNILLETKGLSPLDV